MVAVRALYPFALIVFLVIITGVAVPCSFGQKRNISKYSTDTALINQLRKKARKQKDDDSGIYLLNRALRMGIAANYISGVANALIDLGKLYMNKGDYPKSLIYLSEALPWCKKSDDPLLLPGCYNNIGLALFYQGDYIKATENYYTALQSVTRQDSASSKMSVYIYTNLSLVSYRIRQMEKSVKYLGMAEEIARARGFTRELISILINKGALYGEFKSNTDSAVIILHEALDMSVKNGNAESEAYAYHNIGEVFMKNKQYELAVSYLQKSNALAANKFNYIYIISSFSLGKAWYKMGKYKDAEKILTSALKNAEAANLKDNLANGYTILKDVYKATGQYRKEAECLETIAAIKDTLMSIEKTRGINQLEMKYNSAQKDKEIAQNQLLIARQKNNIAEKNTWIIGIVAGVVLLSLLLAGIYRSSMDKDRILAEQIKSLQQENKISVLKGVVQGEENERMRLARELHDGIGGMLSAVMMGFIAIKHEKKDIGDVPAYNEVMNLLNEMGDEIRKTAHNLMPEVLLKQNLNEAIRAHCNYVEKASTLQVDFQQYGSFDNISQHIKLNVYRIVQELLKNTMQHSLATKALVQLMIHENILTITVEDNGSGFDIHNTTNGIGLHNLQTRVRSLDGQFNFKSEAGKGTSVYIEIDIS